VGEWALKLALDATPGAKVHHNVCLLNRLPGKLRLLFLCCVPSLVALLVPGCTA
jgi:hypothetical protein